MYTINKFRVIAFLEGISYLLLLFVAMPVKYVLEQPALVKMVGMGHGILFIAFIILLVQSAFTYRWKMGFNLIAFIASLLPFATFWLEKNLEHKAKALS
ncbi:MAG: DUF3817 domain-containing protein [Campylobacterota bacterium]